MSSRGTLCFDVLLVLQLSVLVLEHLLVVTRALVQLQFRLELPKGVYVVIDTHLVLCYCLMTHDCVLAGGSAAALATGSA